MLKIKIILTSVLLLSFINANAVLTQSVGFSTDPIGSPLNASSTPSTTSSKLVSSPIVDLSALPSLPSLIVSSPSLAMQSSSNLLSSPIKVPSKVLSSPMKLASDPIKSTSMGVSSLPLLLPVASSLAIPLSSVLPLSSSAAPFAGNSIPGMNFQDIQKQVTDFFNGFMPK